MNETIVKMTGITKFFGGVHALDNVDFELKKGEIHAVVGENGAGKSTLMKILMGLVPKDDGEILYNGSIINFAHPAEALRKGVSMIHQEISLVPEMDVAENIWLGQERKFLSAGLVNSKKRYHATDKLLKGIGLNINSRAKIKNLSVAQMQLIELARAISYNISVLIMDEPTSALTDQEIKLLYKVVSDLSVKGVGVVFISHKLEEVFEMCERATILRDGKLIAVKRCDEMTKQDLVNMIVGREVKNLFERKKVDLGETIFEAKHVSREGVFEDVSFNVRKGEILGVCGLMGAGRTEILRAIFGIDKITSGDIFVEGKKVKIKTPKSALRNGIGMVNEDRLRMGLIYTMSVLYNATIAVFFRLCNKLGFYNRKKEEGMLYGITKDLSIKYGSSKDLIGSLSGGNQQKVIIGRWLLTEPKILFMDEPTRGIDVGSKAEIYKLIDDLSARGLGIVMVSSEMPEILALSDRIVVVRNGRIVCECDRAEATQESLMVHAFGV